MNSYQSGLEVIPLVLEHTGHVNKVIDVGCGDMGWLRACVQLGIGQDGILGIDRWSLDEADEKVPPETRSELLGRDSRRIDQLPYLKMDLRAPDAPSKKSRWLGSDLVICLETAEHLLPEYGEGLVSFICSLAPRYVLWSAAVPGQGPYPPNEEERLAGNPNWHHNERSAAYWEGLFVEQYYRLVCRLENPIQEAIKAGAEIDPWYWVGIALYTRRGI